MIAMGSASPTLSSRCSVVIATLDRIASLRLVLECLGRQTRLPCEILIVAAGETGAVVRLAGEFQLGCPVRVLTSPVKSSACQRNQAAAEAVGDVIAFLDDDIEFAPDLFSRTLAHFDAQPAAALSALSPRIANTGRDHPGWLTRSYFRIQAGYSHADYGGRVFGPGINCFPLFEPAGPEIVPVEWLPSTCLFVRAACFRRHQFPRFAGYSYAEDVHLTTRLAREAPLWFLREPSILHHSLPSEFKANRAELTAGKLHNMAVVARETLGRRPLRLWWQWQLHRLFMSLVLLLRRPAGWRADLRGVWIARL